jgi:O-antigen/teichoic acid export membrane protein
MAGREYSGFRHASKYRASRLAASRNDGSSGQAEVLGAWFGSTARSVCPESRQKGRTAEYPPRGGVLSTTTTRGTGRRTVLLLVAAVLVAGLLVNVYLALVARLLPSAGDYGHFGAFWSIALVIGFGAFLPLEQEMARVLQTTASPHVALRLAAGAALALAGGAVVLVLVLLPVLRSAYDGSTGLILATLAVVVVSAVQFLLRGLLIGLGRLTVHAAVLAADAVLRVVLVLVVAATGADQPPSSYAWTLVVAILVAHLPVLPWAVRQVRSLEGPGHGGGVDLPPGSFAGAIGHLLVASLFAQVLLNGPPLLVAALATAGEQDAAGRFLAAFTLARIPLFVAVPIQSTLVPVLARLVSAGRRRELVRLVGRASLGLLGLALLGGLLAWIVGPALVGWIFGSRYVLPGTDLALMVVGVVAHLGLLLVAQALVAGGRHSSVALTWALAVGAACIPALLISDLLGRGEWAFLTGSVVGWLLGTLLLTRRPESDRTRTSSRSDE